MRLRGVESSCYLRHCENLAFLRGIRLDSVIVRESASFGVGNYFCRFYRIVLCRHCETIRSIFVAIYNARIFADSVESTRDSSDSVKILRYSQN